MAKKKYYAVACGNRPGIYKTWPEAEAQVKGYSGARFKGFASIEDAEQWLNGGHSVVKKKVPQQPEQSDNLSIYTDGGAIGNPGPGGYGVVLQDGLEQREMSGGFRLTTNNRMELMACIVALRELVGSNRSMILYSDSKYVVDAIRKGWAKAWRKRNWQKANGQPAANPDLWQELLELVQGLDIRFQWLKGHAGNPLNERCDQLAVSAARGDKLAEDSGYQG